MMPENCDRCNGAFDNMTTIVLASHDHPVISETGNLTYYVCEDCSSRVLLLLSEAETEPVVIRVP